MSRNESLDRNSNYPPMSDSDWNDAPFNRGTRYQEYLKRLDREEALNRRADYEYTKRQENKYND